MFSKVKAGKEVNEDLPLSPEKNDNVENEEPRWINHK
jgi:hypothetical protein